MRPDVSLRRIGADGAAYLRALVDSTGLTQSQAAERVGVDARSMRRYLSATDGIDAPYTVQFALECLAAGERADATPVDSTAPVRAERADPRR